MEPSRSCGYPWVVLIDLDTTEFLRALAATLMETLGNRDGELPEGRRCVTSHPLNGMSELVTGISRLSGRPHFGGTAHSAAEECLYLAVGSVS